jgi:hypothetical protein
MAITVDIDLTNPLKAKQFLYWAKDTNTKYDLSTPGYIISVQFKNIFDLLKWL